VLLLTLPGDDRRQETARHSQAQRGAAVLSGVRSAPHRRGRNCRSAARMSGRKWRLPASAGQTAHKDQLQDGGRQETVRLTVWWHPARDLDLQVIRWELKTRPPHVVVRLPNGSGIRIPLSWTNADADDTEPVRRLRFTSQSLLELTGLVESLVSRSSDACIGASGGEDSNEAAMFMEHGTGSGEN
jgi:hypothetical protein